MRLIGEQAKTLMQPKKGTVKRVLSRLLPDPRARLFAYRVFAYRVMCLSGINVQQFTERKELKRSELFVSPMIRNIRRTFSFVACCFASSVLHRDRPYYNRMIFGLMQLCG